jgi:alcohol dehydrogenase
MDDLQALVAMAEAGRLAPHIDRVLPLEESAEAERMLEERRVFGKIILKP